MIMLKEEGFMELAYNAGFVKTVMTKPYRKLADLAYQAGVADGYRQGQWEMRMRAGLACLGMSQWETPVQCADAIKDLDVREHL